MRYESVITRPAPAALLGTLLLATASAARAAGAPCSSDVFAVDGAQLTIALCDRGPVATAHGQGGTLVETIGVRDRAPIVHVVAYDRLPNETTTRTIDDVSLAPLGIGRTLHLTVAIRDRGIRLEHALLVPGAIDLR